MEARLDGGEGGAGGAEARNEIGRLALAQRWRWTVRIGSEEAVRVAGERERSLRGSGDRRYGDPLLRVIHVPLVLAASYWFVYISILFFK